MLKGLQDGIERWNRILMPGLLGLLVLMAIHAVFLPGFVPAVEFLFAPDFSSLTPPGILEAIGHSFFTLSVGVGVMITYGSYIDKKESLPKLAFSVALMDCENDKMMDEQKVEITPAPLPFPNNASTDPQHQSLPSFNNVNAHKTHCDSSNVCMHSS